MNIGVVMAALYECELNCSLSCFWDGGWDVKLGDEMNGFKAQSNFDSLDECATWLKFRAIENYPKGRAAILEAIERHERRREILQEIKRRSP